MMGWMSFFQCACGAVEASFHARRDVRPRAPLIRIGAHAGRRHKGQADIYQVSIPSDSIRCRISIFRRCGIADGEILQPSRVEFRR